MAETNSSPLDELRIPADRVWDKIAGGDMPTPAELSELVKAERAMRAEWIKKERAKREKKDK